MSDGKVVIDIDGDPKGFDREIKGLGKTVTSGLGGALKGAAAGALKVVTGAGAILGGALIAGMGVVVKKGLDRALNIEDAKASMKGLGYTVAEIETITNSVLGAVKGTAFALDDGMKIASSALAAGIAPGKELENYVRLIGDAATIAKAPLGEVGQIFNKVFAKGKIQAEEMNQLHERGIPILQWLAEDYGVTADAMTKMVSKGEVDAARFASVMEKNLGGAALQAGDTVRGAWDNVMAAIGRAGERLVSASLGPAHQFFNAFIEEIDGITPAFEKVGLGFAAALTGGSTEGLTEGLTEIAAKLAEGIGQIAPVVITALVAVIIAVAKALPALLPPLASAFVDGISAIADALPEVIPAILWAMRQVVVRIAAALPEILPVIARAFVDVMMEIADVLPVIIPPLISALRDVIMILAQALPEWLPLILQAFVVLIVEIVEAFAGMAPTLVPIIFELMIILVAEILKALPLFLKAAFDLIGGLIKGFDNNQSNLLKVVKEQALGVLKSWLDSVPKMLDAGKKLLIGIKDGAVDGFNTRLVPFLKGLGNAALDALGNLGNTLKNAGIKLLQGLWDGALEKWKKVKEWVSSIADWIADHKGPLDRDYRLLQPAGRLIMEGFRKTLGEGFALVLADLDRYTRQLSMPLPSSWSPTLAVAGSASAAAPVGGRVNNFEINFTKTPERWSDVVFGFRDIAEVL